MSSVAPPIRPLCIRQTAAGLARDGLITAVFCCAIALALTLSGKGHWQHNLAYSLAIGLVSWLVIDGGRLLVARHEPGMWPRGWRGVALVAVGTLAGFAGGVSLVELWCQCTQWTRWASAPQAPITALVITVMATVATSFFFHSQGTARAMQAHIARIERDATEARLRLLEAQLEPHMLFNTLANLRVLIATDPQRAQAMLDHLIDYLRATLGASRSTQHPLADEFLRLHDYLALMAVRMGPRLRFALDLPDTLRQVPVPPLLLQPLVENAIRHGLEPQVEGGTITVTARSEGPASAPRLVLEVQDTGVGLAAAPNATPGSHFGLAQVRERLHTLYGDQGALELIAAGAYGLRARVTFPLKN